jgi:phage terminase large subunit-like protein
MGRIALIGETVSDVRDVMIEGESGLLGCYPPGQAPRYIASKRKIEWPNGAIATTYSGQEPDQLRGPQHDGYWADELAKWQYAQEAWDNLQFGLRLGANPRGVVTTTPRPLAIIRALCKSADTVVTRGSTFDNRSNLPTSTLDVFRQKYEGTRIGRQELYAELLDDFPGALWQRSQIDKLRIMDKAAHQLLEQMQRIAVAIDPAVTSEEDSDETGIVGCGKGQNGSGYLLADRSCRDTPLGWAKRACDLVHELKADCIVAEINNGGEMVASTIHTVDPNVRVITVHATRGKARRAEPIAALYEQGRVHHVGPFDQLEDQMCALTADGYGLSGSPDRADAAVWGFTELMLGDSPGIRFFDLN